MLCFHRDVNAPLVAARMSTFVGHCAEDPVSDLSNALHRQRCRSSHSSELWCLYTQVGSVKVLISSLLYAIAIATLNTISRAYSHEEHGLLVQIAQTLSSKMFKKFNTCCKIQDSSKMLFDYSKT